MDAIPNPLLLFKDEIKVIGKELHLAIFDFFNENGSLAKLVLAREAWLELRAKINKEADCGALLAVKQFEVSPFLFTGDPAKDLGQNSNKKLSN